MPAGREAPGVVEEKTVPWAAAVLLLLLLELVLRRRCSCWSSCPSPSPCSHTDSGRTPPV